LGNLARNAAWPDPGTQHAIFCRNALMYFSAQQYRRAVAGLAGKLVPGGLLFLGHAETLRGIDTNFQLVSDRGAFYYQLGGATPGRSTGGAWPYDATQSEPDPSPNDLSWMDSIAQSAARVQALSVAEPEPSGPAPDAPLTLFREERFEQALEALRSLPRATAQEPEMKLLEAVLLFHQSDWAAAESASRELLLQHHLAASAHYLHALCCEARAKLDTATLHDQAAIGSDPSFSLPRLHLGRMLRRLGANERAADELVYARHLLEQEDPARLALFGAGLGRSSLLAFCDAELLQARREVRP
jgi:chemotaxis protein methyltransferase CheR